MDLFFPPTRAVSLNDRMLCIQGKTDRKTDDGCRFYQEVSRQYLLPENVETDEIKSLLFTVDGVSVDFLLFPLGRNL